MMPKPQFEELDFRETPLGDLSLRRRTILALDNREVHEIILGDAYLMSSLFTKVEEELARRGLAAVDNQSLDVVVGGLGLGYTAIAALEDSRVCSLRVIDFLKPVIEWHQSELVPLGKKLNSDKRCEFVHGDFFAMAADSFDPADVERKFHAVLLDIDHSPELLLHGSHASFYSEQGLQKMADQIHPEGIFALWSDEPPEDKFIQRLQNVFSETETHVVEFPDPLQHDRDFASTIYIAKRV